MHEAKRERERERERERIKNSYKVIRYWKKKERKKKNTKKKGQYELWKVGEANKKGESEAKLRR